MTARSSVTHERAVVRSAQCLKLQNAVASPDAQTRASEGSVVQREPRSNCEQIRVDKSYIVGTILVRRLASEGCGGMARGLPVYGVRYLPHLVGEPRQQVCSFYFSNYIVILTQ